MRFDFTPLKMLTFDCYDTLVDWGTGILRELRPRYSQAADEKILATFAAAEAAEEARTPGKPYPGILEATVQRMAIALGLAVDAGHMRRFGASVGDWPPFPDTTSALRRLQTRHKLGILSNVDHGSFAITESKLGVIFDLVITAAEVGTYKPNAENFRILLSRAMDVGIRRQEILHVAQSLYHDHVPAQALGLSACWIDRRQGRDGGAALGAGSVTPHVSFGLPRRIGGCRWTVTYRRQRAKNLNVVFPQTLSSGVHKNTSPASN